MIDKELTITLRKINKKKFNRAYTDLLYDINNNIIAVLSNYNDVIILNNNEVNKLKEKMDLL